jgi:hypothetical protein
MTTLDWVFFLGLAVACGCDVLVWDGIDMARKQVNSRVVERRPAKLISSVKFYYPSKKNFES